MSIQPFSSDWKRATTWVRLGLVVDRKGVPIRKYQTFLAWLKKGKVECQVLGEPEFKRPQYWVHRDEINRIRLEAHVKPV